MLAAGAAARNGNDSSDDEKQEAAHPSPLKKRQTKVKPSDIRQSLDVGEECTETDAEIEANIAFCCKICNCPDEEKQKFSNDEYIQESVECLWHRRCCHRTGNAVGADWLSEYGKGMAQLGAKMWNGATSEEAEEIIEVVEPNEVYQKYISNKRQEAELHNEDDDACK